MNSSFYHVYIEDDNNNIETDYGYFRFFSHAFAICKERNEELGNDSGDLNEQRCNVKKWGSIYCGCFTIEACYFED